MDVQVLCIDDCPNSETAVALMRRALDSVGLVDTPIEVRVISPEAEAVGAAFGGSPTFLIDGADPFPGRRTRTLACRIYATENGLAGTPTQTDLEQAIQRNQQSDG